MHDPLVRNALKIASTAGHRVVLSEPSLFPCPRRSTETTLRKLAKTLLGVQMSYDRNHDHGQEE
jgi:hypothetical protein